MTEQDEEIAYMDSFILLRVLFLYIFIYTKFLFPYLSFVFVMMLNLKTNIYNNI